MVPVGVVALERRRVDLVRKVQGVGFADDPVGPGLILFHHDEAADGPVVFARIHVVVVGAAEIRSHHDDQAVSHFMGLRQLPQIVDGIRQVPQ